MTEIDEKFNGNRITYVGRVVNAKKGDLTFTQAKTGMKILNLLLAERHTMKKSAAKRNPLLKKYVDEPFNANKGDDDYIGTTTTWHRLTIMGDKAEELALQEEINAGALLVVADASYVEEGAWVTKDGVSRAGRPETIGDRNGLVLVKFPPKDAAEPLWDGESEVPSAGGNGGGSSIQETPESEGF